MSLTDDSFLQGWVWGEGFNPTFGEVLTALNVEDEHQGRVFDLFGLLKSHSPEGTALWANLTEDVAKPFREVVLFDFLAEKNLPSPFVVVMQRDTPPGFEEAKRVRSVFVAEGSTLSDLLKSYQGISEADLLDRFLLFNPPYGEAAVWGGKKAYALVKKIYDDLYVSRGGIKRMGRSLDTDRKELLRTPFEHPVYLWEPPDAFETLPDMPEARPSQSTEPSGSGWIFASMAILVAAPLGYLYLKSRGHFNKKGLP